MTKKKIDYVCELLQASAKGKNTPTTGLEAVILAAGILNNIAKNYETLNAAFQEVGMDNPWGECPECGTPVLYEMWRCPVSGTELTIGGEAEAEEVAEAVEEPVSKKAAKKKDEKKASKKKVEPEPEPEEEEVDEELDEEEEVEEELPSYDEIVKMKRPELLQLIETHELDLDADEYKKIAELREAVNEAIDELAGEDEEDEDVEEDAETLEDADEEETEEDDEDSDEEEEDDDDLDLDDVDLDDLDDDLDGLEDEDLED